MFEKSIADMESGRYLGDIKVVSKLAGQFIDGVVNAGNVEEIVSMTRKYRDIFMGLDRHYIPVENWNNERNLGRVLARRLSVSDQEAWGELFKTAFMVFAQYALQIVKESQGKADEVVQAEVQALVKYMISILMGTADTLYPLKQ